MRLPPGPLSGKNESMKIFSTFFSLAAFFLTLSLVHAERPTLYPFDVKIGGHLAVFSGNPDTTLFATIEEPVASDAEIVLPNYESGMVIINVFQIDAQGSPVPGFQPLIYTVQEGGKIGLHQSIDQRRPSAGLYGANIVYSGQTSRVKFTVK